MNNIINNAYKLYNEIENSNISLIKKYMMIKLLQLKKIMMSTGLLTSMVIKYLNF